MPNNDAQFLDLTQTSGIDYSSQVLYRFILAALDGDSSRGRTLGTVLSQQVCLFLKLTVTISNFNLHTPPRLVSLRLVSGPFSLPHPPAPILPLLSHYPPKPTW